MHYPDSRWRPRCQGKSRDDVSGRIVQIRLAPMWQQSGTLLFCSCHGIAGFLVDELQI